MGTGTIRVDVSHRRGLVVVTVAGEITMVTAPTLDAALNELTLAKRVVLDLSGLSFMDSSGVNLLLAHQQRMSDAGGALLVRCPSWPLHHVTKVPVGSAPRRTA